MIGDEHLRPSNDAVERAAKVLCEMSLNGGEPDRLDGRGNPHWHQFREAATAQLVALQEERLSRR